MRSLVSCLLPTVLIAVAAATFSGCKDKNKTPAAHVPSTPRAATAEVTRILSEAEFAFQMQDYARAEKLTNEAIAIDRENAALYVRLSQLCVLQRNTSTAKAALDKALKCFGQDIEKDAKAKPAIIDRLMDAVGFMFDQKQLDLAEIILNQTVSWDKENPALHMRVAAIKIAQNNKAEAKAAYERALKLIQSAIKKAPKEPALVADLITVRILMRQPAEAQKILDQAVKDFPKVEDFKVMQKENYVSEIMKDPEAMQYAL